MRARAVALAGLIALLSAAAGLQPLPQPPPGPKDASKPAETPPGPPTGDSPAPTGAAGFAIRLEPEFALENGPVVYRITLTNRTREPRECWRHTHNCPVHFTQTPDWIRKPWPGFEVMAICGHYGPYHERIDAGKFTRELIAVQNGYQRIPPGRVSVDFEWNVVGEAKQSWHTGPRSTGVSVREEEGAEPREPVRGSRSLEVLPATPANVARTREKLEEHLREAIGGTRPIREVVQCLAGSRHAEFVPLMIRAVQLYDGHQYRDLIDTIYDSYRDPETGFEQLFPLLEAGDPATRHSLDYWHIQEMNLRMHQHLVADLAKPKARHGKGGNGDDEDPYTRIFAPMELEAWNFARVHPNSRLTLGQHARIQAVKNVWTRAAYWQTFPESCSPDWVLCLFADLKRTTLPPDEKAVQAVCRDLAADRFAVRERAMTAAMRMDERVLPALRDYLKQHPSAEYEQRVTLIAQYFERQPIPPLAKQVIEKARYSDQLQRELIFAALSAPPGTCRVADLVRAKKQEVEKEREAELERRRSAERWRQAQQKAKEAAGQPER